ncbi:MAG TPA: hypothetical protein VKX17_21455 [Planctomycetota bacterium]|nr:hypothetical protein [Planctomycetota bacterium]
MRRKSAPLSNAALLGLGALALMTASVLGALLHFSRSQKTPDAGRIAASPSGGQASDNPDSVRLKAELQSSNSLSRYVDHSPPKDVAAANAPLDDAPVIRVAARSIDESAEPLTSNTAPATPIESAPSTLNPAESTTATAQANSVEEAPPHSAAPLANANSKDSNELIPELTGPSYTAKKAMSAGAAPSPNKPNGRAPDPKKTPTPLVPPKAPAKADATKMPPSPPALPPVDKSKMDFSHAPVYILNDGRRIRAVAVRDNGATLSIKNEAGTEITFKKTDVKEIQRN